MFYKPRKNKNLWDTLVFYHDGTYYLYYLVSDPSNLYGVCLATSPDGVLWKEHGMIFHRSADARWMATGTIIKALDFDRSRKFLITYSEWFGPKDDVGQNTIFIAESTDLINWKSLGPSSEFPPDTRYYRANEGNGSRWDGIYTVPRPGGGFYGFWTANPKDFHPGFGYGETLDGVKWNALPPPRIDWDGKNPMNNIEVGGVEKIGNKYYMMVGTWGLEKYEGHGGMLTFTSDQLEGPYKPENRNFHLVTSTGHLHSYFTRYCPSPEGMLVNHQLIPRFEDCYFGLLKVAEVDSDGVLRLAYWPKNDLLKGDPLENYILREMEGGAALLGDADGIGNGLILEGDVDLALHSSRFPVELMIEADRGKHTLIRIHRDGSVDIGSIESTTNPDQPLDEARIDRLLHLRDQCRFRLFLDKCLFELYINDYLIQCFSLYGNATGRILYCGNYKQSPILELKVWHGRSQP